MSAGSKGYSEVGQPIARREDRRLLLGAGRFLDDIVIPGALHATFVRSPHAHARIVSIDTSAARDVTGVVGVYTGADLVNWTTRQRMAPPIEGLLPTEMSTLPVDKVRFQGDLVACVVASDRYIAEDAAELVSVDYDVLDAVIDFGEAVAAGAPLVDDTVPGNLLAHQTFQVGNPASHHTTAHAVIRERFVQHRQTHVPLETRGCAAVWDEGREHLTMHIGNQVPHPYRTQLAARLGLTESQVTVVSPDVGGGFGQKIALYREELTVAALARHLKRPIRWREDRMENLQAASHARQATCETVASVDATGRILGLELSIREDFGAYCFYPGNYIARVIALVLTGPYRITDYAYDIKVALTNKCGVGPMRAPMAMTSWVMDGTIDAIARTLGLDPLDVRRVNMIPLGETRYTMPTGETVMDITPHETLDAVVAEIDYAAFRRRQTSARTEGRYLGLGLCSVVEPTTYGSRFYKSAGIAGSGHEAAWVRIEPSGTVRASVGLMGTGQGYETSLAQAVAEGLGVDTSIVRIDLGNTDIAPYGMGSRGARGGTAGGGALYLCAQKAQAHVLKIAAHVLNLNTSDDLRLAKGQVLQEIGGVWVETGLTLATLARQAYLDPLALPDGVAPGLDFSHAYEPPSMTYSNSAHACEVEVDRSTGRVSITRYVVAEDCGTVLNPIVVRGQQQGAIAMGLSGALMEAVIYDATGQNLSSTLADYRIAGALELPHFEILPMHTPNRATPLGQKGMAEGGVMGAIGALSNAIDDALSIVGVRAECQPFTPQYIQSLLNADN
jgi:carbon-monoxide dehydrogenase large subunit